MSEEGPLVDEEQGEEHHPSDLSVPWWVWVILGFALVMAVVIVIIIWSGGGSAPEGTQGPDAAEVEEEYVDEEYVDEEAAEPTTEPAEQVDPAASPAPGVPPAPGIPTQ